MDSNEWSDIGYSFLTGGDGSIFEGCGYNAQGAHTSGFNDVGYANCFIGDFMEVPPEPEQINAVLAHIDVSIVNVPLLSH